MTEHVVPHFPTPAGTWAGTVFSGGEFHAPEWLHLDMLQACWTDLKAAFASQDWLGDPLGSIWAMWRATVDFAGAFLQWLLTVIRDLTDITFPDFFNVAALKAAWQALSTTWLAIDWLADPFDAVHDAWTSLVQFSLDIAAWGGVVLTNLTGLQWPGFFEIDELRGLWQAFTTATDNLNWLTLSAYWTLIDATVDLGLGLIQWGLHVFRNLSGLDVFQGLWDALDLDTFWNNIDTFGDTILGINWLIEPAGLFTAIRAAITLLQAEGRWLLGVIEAILRWESSVIHDMFSSFPAFIKTIVEFFTGIDGLGLFQKVLDILSGVTGGGLSDAVKGLMNFITGFSGLTGLTGLTGSGGILDFFTKSITDLLAVFTGVHDESPDTVTLVNLIEKFTDFLQNVPLIGALVRAITGDENAAADMGGLAEWFQTTVLKNTSPLPANNLFGAIPGALLGLIPVGHIDQSAPNLVLDGGFGSASVMQQGGQWTFDPAKDSGSGGGSAKVAANSTEQHLFSNVIDVAAGQELTVTTQAWRGGLAGSGDMAVLGVRTYAGGSQVTAFTPLAASATTGTSSSWETLSYAWTVPAGITSVRVGVGVTAAATGGSVHFDAVSAGKTNLLDQGLVKRLLDAWNNAWAAVYGGNPTGKTVDDLGTAIGAAWTAAGLGVTNAQAAQGTADVAEASATTANDNLDTTWNTIADMFTNNTSTNPFGAGYLHGFWQAHRGQHDALLAAQSTIGQLQSQMAAIAGKLYAADDFERGPAALDADGLWVVTETTGYGNVDLDGHTAKWTNSTGSHANWALCRFIGDNGATYGYQHASSAYPSVSAVVGTVPQSASAGAASIDLIANLSDNQYHFVRTRFRGDGLVQVSYYENGTEYSLGQQQWDTVTSGTTIRMDVGDIANLQPSVITVRQNSSIVMSVNDTGYASHSYRDGRGWGFAMQVYGGVPLGQVNAGSLYQWTAQDQ